MSDEKVLVEKELLKALFDMAVNSMDFGSGMLYNEDVVILRQTALLIDVDPDKGTPSEFKASFAHDYVNEVSKTFYPEFDFRNSEWREDNWRAKYAKTALVCGLCSRLESNPVHHGVTVKEPTSEYEDYKALPKQTNL